MLELENGQSPAATARRSVKVEFAPRNNKTIHLEVDFQESGGHYEKVNSRWVESDWNRSPAESRPLLQAVILNPERQESKYLIVIANVTDSYAELIWNSRFEKNRY